MNHVGPDAPSTSLRAGPRLGGAQGLPVELPELRSGGRVEVPGRYATMACCYNSAVFRKILVVITGLAGAIVCPAQEASPPPKPQVKVHMLNVCAPSPEEQQEIASALSRVPAKPSFSPDFEVDRGRSVLDPSANPLITGNSTPMSSDTASADFVRIRHDFTGQSIFSTVQYSFSRDSKQMVETLVFRVREAKDLLQISIEDSASTVTTAAAMLGAGTPASRIRLERFGKSSVVLARCSGEGEGPAPDQSTYEPLFASASAVLSDYRRILGAKATVPAELARVGGLGVATKPPAKKLSTPDHK
jgi:hypothetical protein